MNSLSKLLLIKSITKYRLPQQIYRSGCLSFKLFFSKVHYIRSVSLSSSWCCCYFLFAVVLLLLFLMWKRFSWIFLYMPFSHFFVWFWRFPFHCKCTVKRLHNISGSPTTATKTTSCNSNNKTSMQRHGNDMKATVFFCGHLRKTRACAEIVLSTQSMCPSFLFCASFFPLQWEKYSLLLVFFSLPSFVFSYFSWFVLCLFYYYSAWFSSSFLPSTLSSSCCFYFISE